MPGLLSTEERDGSLCVEGPIFKHPYNSSRPNGVRQIVLKIVGILLIVFTAYAIWDKVAERTTNQHKPTRRFADESTYIMDRDIDVLTAALFNYIPPSQEEIEDCKTKRFTKTGGWCLTPNQIVARRKNPMRSLAWYLADFFVDQTVADIGAGLGIFKEIIVAKGKARYVVAFDGAINVHDVSNGLVEFRDFAKPQRIGVYDWVYSIEVAEHVPKEFEDVFIENLVRAADRGIVLTWAHIGQRGDGHVNCQDRAYVLKKFEDKGFQINEKELEKMRPSVKEHIRVNLYVFVKAKLFSHGYYKRRGHPNFRNFIKKK